MLKIAVFVSGNGSNLQSLLDSKLQGGEISLVLSNHPNAYALHRAKAHNVPAKVICKEHFNEEVLPILQAYDIDCIVLAGFLQILSPTLIQAFPQRIINIHPSLLPSFGGKGFYGIKVHQAVLDYGVKVSGASVHFVNEVVDGGQIILQKATTISAKETPQSLQKKIMKIEQALLPKALQILIHQILKENNAKA